jgi:hypothetical protein
VFGRFQVFWSRLKNKLKNRVIQPEGLEFLGTHFKYWNWGNSYLNQVG